MAKRFKDRECSRCGKKGFSGPRAMQAHHREAHGVPSATKPAERAQASGIEYSFFNSPKELVLELEKYRITITRKG
jgi:hypothetical protein